MRCRRSAIAWHGRRAEVLCCRWRTETLPTSRSTIMRRNRSVELLWRIIWPHGPIDVRITGIRPAAAGLKAIYVWACAARAADGWSACTSATLGQSLAAICRGAPLWFTEAMPAALLAPASEVLPLWREPRSGISETSPPAGRRPLCGRSAVSQCERILHTLLYQGTLLNRKK